MTCAKLPVLDAATGLMIKRGDGRLATNPCGECVEYGIYATCYRDDGCGEEECAVEITPTTADKDYCGGVDKLVFTSTRITEVNWTGTAGQDGYVSVRFLIDCEVVRTWNQQEVNNGLEYDDAYVPASDLYLDEGWHPVKVEVIWKNEAEEEVSRETFVACVYSANPGTVAISDVAILPDTPTTPICYNETLEFLRLLGPYRSYTDAQFVLTNWAEIINEWAHHCLCEITCTGSEVYKSHASDEFPPGDSDITVNFYGLFIQCLPSPYPVHVTRLDYCTESDSDFAAYIKIYNQDNEEIDEIDITGCPGSTSFTIPPCCIAKIIIVNNEGGNIEVIAGLTAWWSNLPEEYEECPYEGDLTDYVPGDADALIAWQEDQ